MIYTIFSETETKVKVEPINLRLITNKFGSDKGVSVIAVDARGNVRSGGYLVTFNADGKVSLVADVSRDFGFQLDDLRRIVLRGNT